MQDRHGCKLRACGHLHTHDTKFCSSCCRREMAKSTDVLKSMPCRPMRSGLAVTDVRVQLIYRDLVVK
jgi:hypothetical protein